MPCAFRDDCFEFDTRDDAGEYVSSLSEFVMCNFIWNRNVFLTGGLSERLRECSEFILRIRYEDIRHRTKEIDVAR